jgi:hypothetical protein
MKITEEVFIKIVRLAFILGETYGATYSSWFHPTDEEKESEVRRTIELCLNELHRQ